MSAQPHRDRSVAVEGDIRDSILVLGDHNVLDVRLGNDAILQRWLDHGDVRIERRAPGAPPPPFPDRVDRDDELAALGSAAGHVNLHGTGGIGKTYIVLAALGAGGVFLDAAQRPVDDLLQALVEALFDGPPGVVLRPERRQRELAGVQERLALDDVRLTPQDAQRLLTEAPNCRFVVASRRRTLMHAQSVRVSGLPLEFATSVIADGLGRPLRPDEEAGARELAERLGGHPLMLRQAAGLAGDTGIVLAELAQALGTEDPVRALSARLQAALTPEDRELLAELASAGGAPLSPGCVTALGGPADAAERLPALESRALVQSHSPRYSLAGALAEAPPEAGRVGAEAAATALAAWAERRDPAEVLDESAALLAVLRRADGAAAIGLARAVERPLALGRRWASWHEALSVLREAAAAAGDASSEAHALHQLGTRAYALGDAAEAVALLEQALALRRQLGESQGVANTQHNLDFIGYGGPPPSDGDDDEPGGGGSGRRGLRALLAGGVAALVVGGVVAIVALGNAGGGGGGDGGGGAGAGGGGDPPVLKATIVAPRAGATFTAGTAIRARFKCTEGVTCRAAVRRGRVGAPRSLPASSWKAVKPGGRLPNQRGSFTLAVVATDTAGNTARDSAAYGVLPAPALAACADGRDNDGDGLVDRKDPGCTSATDDDEANVSAKAACADGRDNDGDGLIDGKDPGCTSATDDDEANVSAKAACADGRDNDGDGLIDGKDPGCTSATDDDEANVSAKAACADGRDNDGDGLIDGKDPGCASATDDDETNSTPACSDQLDNDDDGLIDSNDPGCDSRTDNDETDPPVTPSVSPQPVE